MIQCKLNIACRAVPGRNLVSTHNLGAENQTLISGWDWTGVDVYGRELRLHLSMFSAPYL
jgi:hypothetical protein